MSSRGRGSTCVRSNEVRLASIMGCCHRDSLINRSQSSPSSEHTAMSQRLHEMSWHPLRPGIRRADLPPGHKTDAANRRQTVTLPNAVVGTYTFDDADQLLALSYANGSTQIGDLSYTYDAAGRRVTAGGSLATLAVPSASVSGTYDAANRLTQWGSAALTYDGNGNVATNGASNGRLQRECSLPSANELDAVIQMRRPELQPILRIALYKCRELANRS